MKKDKKGVSRNRDSRDIFSGKKSIVEHNRRATDKYSIHIPDYNIMDTELISNSITKEMDQFSTGATRDLSDDKLDYEGFIHPLVLERFSQYMHKHRSTPYGLRSSDNWQKGIPLANYMKSMLRHTMEVWKYHRGVPSSTMHVGSNKTEPFDIEEMLCAVMFNVMGYLYELLRKK